MKNHKTTQMRFLVYSPYYPPHIGGLESHSDQFNRHLSPFVKKITVFTPKLPQAGKAEEVLYGNVEIIRFPAFEIIPNYPVAKFWSPTFWKLFFDLFRQDFDIIISRTRFFPTSLLALIHAKTRRTRWIHIEHGSDFVQLSSKFKTYIAKIYDQIFGRLIFRNADLVVSISKAVQKFVYKFDKRKSPVIYRGLEIDELEKIKPDLKTKNEFAGRIIISFVGRLYKWKGVENSINAIKLLPPELKEKIVFLIIGDGEDFKHLEKISQGEKTIKILGNLPHAQTIGILKISDIYLHSAYSGGGLSTSLLEAMYCGCAVIATPNEGAYEVIVDQDNGFLVAKSDKNMLAEKIQELLGGTDVDKFKKEAKRTVEEKFIWEKTIGKYLELLNDRS